MSKTLDRLVQEDQRICSKSGWEYDREGKAYFLYLANGYIHNDAYTIYGKTVKEIVQQLPEIYEGEWK